MTSYPRDAPSGYLVVSKKFINDRNFEMPAVLFYFSFTTSVYYNQSADGIVSRYQTHFQNNVREIYCMTTDFSEQYCRYSVTDIPYIVNTYTKQLSS